MAEQKYPKIINTQQRYCVSIAVTFEGGAPVDEVVYFNYGLTLDILIKYKPYWEYVAARVKVKHPRRSVLLNYGTCQTPCGQDWIDEHLPKRLEAKRRKLKSLMNPTKTYQDDLFGFASTKRLEDANKLRQQIERLEAGLYDAYVPPTYVNNIKKWTV